MDPASSQASPDPATLYRDRLILRGGVVERCALVSRRISMGRLALFLAIVALVWVVIARRGDGAVWLGIPVAGFVALVIWHERVESRRARAERAAAYYQRGLARLTHRWMEGGVDGSALGSPSHLYADDLDLFGPGSLFQLLCVARTGMGQRRLADWLMDPAAPGEILARQTAVQELASRLDLREQLALAGPELAGALDPGRLARWAVLPRSTLPAWTEPMAMVLGAANLTTLALTIAGVLPGTWLAASVIVSSLFWMRVRGPAMTALRSTDAPGRELEVLRALLMRLEAEPFAAPRLAGLRSGLPVNGRPASRLIGKLQLLLDLRDSQSNLMFAPVAALSLLPAILAVRIERWRSAYGEGVIRWLDAVADLEALVSLATYAAEHPDDAWPELSSGEACLDVEGLAHPLLPRDAAIRNDVALDAHRPLLMVSGSNMSGKSTLLRATGLAVVMAQAGGPAPASRLRLTPIAPGASIRARDSVQDGRSRFYAEIERVRRMVEIAGSKERTLLFLLDELLSGTNSHDRRIGAEAIVRTLAERGGLGMVTTHDLALTAIADAMGSRARNVHFEDQLEDGRIRFDYRLRDGVVRRSNALALMRAVGLEVPDPPDASQ
jgi:hypothetical protein